MKNSQRTILTILLVATVGLLVYSNTFNVPFHFDDKAVIVDNPIIKKLVYFVDPAEAQVFDKHFEYKSFLRRYVGYLTFALNYRIHGLDVTGYHIVNLFIHILNAIIVYFFVLFTFDSPFLDRSSIKGYAWEIATVTALLFIAHPIHTQAVTYIWQRVTSLSTLLYMLSLLFYISWRLKEDKGSSFNKGALYLLCIISAVLAMKTKEIAFTLPLIIAAYEFIFFEGPLKRRVLVLLPILLTMLIIPYGLMDVDRPVGAMIGDLDDVTMGHTELTRTEYLFTSFRVIVTYVRLVILPVNQNLDYDYPVYGSFFEKEVFLSFIFLLAVFISGTYLHLRYKKKYPQTGLVMFGMFLFFMGLALESSVIPLNNVICEHRLYLPSIGVFTLLSVSVYMAVEKLRVRWKGVDKVAAFVIAMAVVLLAGATYARNGVWKDSVSLWSDVISKSPEKERPYNNRGYAYMKLMEYKKAIADFNRAVDLNPKYEAPYNNRGSVYRELKQYDRAIADYDKAIEINPEYALAYNNRGNAYKMIRKYEKAISDYNKAIDADPVYALVFYNRGTMYQELGEYEKAVADYYKVIELDPEFVSVYNNRGTLYLELKLYEKAIADYNRAIELDPEYALAYNNRGSAYFKLKKYDSAIADYSRAIELDPGYASAYNNRGRAYSELKQYERAISDLDKAIELNSEYALAYNNRGNAYRRLGRNDDAERDLRMAESLGKTGDGR